MFTLTKRTTILIVLFIIVAGLGILLSSNKFKKKNNIQNVVLVIFDTLRADRISIYGHDKDTSPYLSSNRNSFLLFTHPRSVAPWTVPSHASIFTGKFPSEHHADWGNMVLGDKFETLAETLSGRGYSTVALVANDLFQRDKPNLLQGFNQVHFTKGPKRQELIIKKFKEELEKTKDSNQPSFIFINFMNNHLPYHPGKYKAAFGAEGKPFLDESTTKWQVNAGHIDFPEKEKIQVRNLYDASVRYSDELTKRLITLLNKHNKLDNTLLIITSDHGDGLGYHKEVGHEISVWEEQLAVPLIMRFPYEAKGGSEINDTVSLVGLHSFILKLTNESSSNIDDAVSGLISDSTYPLAEYRSYFSETNRGYNKKYADLYPELANNIGHMHVLYCGDYKLHVRSKGDIAFFNIAADPLEQKDLHKENLKEYEDCLKQYNNLLAQGRFTPFDFNPTSLNSSKDAVDSQEVEALKSLGYL